eukprot:gene11960-13940_t
MTFVKDITTFGHMSRRKKSLHQLKMELEETHDAEDGKGKSDGLKKCLTVFDLLAFGVGAIIGSGIFVLTGVAAKEKAGPAVILSYLVSGFACALSGLAYAEFATRVPCSGSTYSYSYIVVGELIAWIIGWDLTLETGGGYLPHPFAPIILGAGFSIDLIAFFSIIILTLIVAFGMKESARFNKVFVVIKVTIVLFVIICGAFYTDTANWQPFTPYGAKGVFNAAAITFFAYLGFDGVCNVAEEVKNPQRDLPIGILGSLGISTVLYMAVSIVLTLMVPYDKMDIGAPLSVAFSNYGLKWATIIVAIGAFAGLTTAQLSGLVSQPRLYYSLSRDGLLPPWFSYIHPRFKTPFYSTLFTGACAALIALFVEIQILADMVSIGTLLSFTLVSTCVLIMRYPAINDKSESNAKWIVRNFPVFLQKPMWLCLIIAVLAGITGAGYAHDLPFEIIVVFGVLMLAVSSIMFFLVPCDIPTGFRCPLVPGLPIVSIWFNMYLMVSLSWETWVRLIVWLFIGFLIYFFYGAKNSRVGREERELKEAQEQHLEDKLRQPSTPGAYDKLTNQEIPIPIDISTSSNTNNQLGDNDSVDSASSSSGDESNNRESIEMDTRSLVRHDDQGNVINDNDRVRLDKD